MEVQQKTVSADETEEEEEESIKYTLPQRVFIYESYVRNDSAKTCRREFREAFPEVSPPKKWRILRLAKNFRNTGLLIDARKIEDKHIKELEIEADENRKRKVAVSAKIMESSVAEDLHSVSEGGPDDISSMIKTEIKCEPPSSPEHGSASNGFEFVQIKKEPKEGTLAHEDSMSSNSSDDPPSQMSEWGLVEESEVPSTTFPLLDALPYPCRHCGCCFKTYTDLKCHISETHAEMVKCKVCGKEFPSRAQLQKHETQHASKQPFTCIECNKEFLSQGRLTSHMKKTHVKIEDDKKIKRKKK